MLSHEIYRNINSEIWVVFIHGLGGNLNTYKKQIPDFTENFNLLLIDLHGHGNTKKSLKDLKEISFNAIAEDILKLMDKLDIKSAHFIGISLGSMLNRVLAEMVPNRVKSIISGGTIVAYTKFARVLIKIADISRNVVPSNFLYPIFASILMPRKNHKLSRRFFCREAEKMNNEEVFTWIDLVSTFEQNYPPEKLKNINVSKLYLCGIEDHMFYSLVKKYALTDENATVCELECGHLPNLEMPDRFNSEAITFVKIQELSYKQNEEFIKEDAIV